LDGTRWNQGTISRKWRETAIGETQNGLSSGVARAEGEYNPIPVFAEQTALRGGGPGELVKKRTRTGNEGGGGGRGGGGGKCKIKLGKKNLVKKKKNGGKS